MVISNSTTLRCAAFFIGLSLLSACSDEPPHPYHEDLGEDWPLTVTGGRLDCNPYDFKAVYYLYEGKRYALNGMASGRIKTGDYVAVDPIWKVDEEETKRINRGTPKSSWWIVKKNLMPLIALGLELCE